MRNYDEMTVRQLVDIVAFLHKPSDTDFMWRREIGLQLSHLVAVDGNVGRIA